MVNFDSSTLIPAANAVERYKNGTASLGKAAEIAGMPIGQMMTVLEELGVQSNIDLEDYRQGLASLAELW